MRPHPTLFVFPKKPNTTILIAFGVEPTFVAMINPPILCLEVCPKPIKVMPRTARQKAIGKVNRLGVPFLGYVATALPHKGRSNQ